MKRILLIVLFCAGLAAKAQLSFKAKIIDSATAELLAGATVKTGKQTAVADAQGQVQVNNLPAGENSFYISFTGYETHRVSFVLPDTAVHLIYLIAHKEELESVTVIASTRTNQRIENSPLKVEVLGREEMDEENSIKPGNIASILSDVSGIQIQQSSAVSSNANIRIQGLEGRYTQILRDGMPLFEGFSGGFGVLQIPPLDLRQIELIKGSASTLYGGGAIGGLVNLISKRPTTKQEVELTLNQTTLKESNVNAYVARRYSGFGYTFFGGATRQGIVDVNKDGLSDVPKLDAVILHPKIFLYPSEKLNAALGYTATFETRKGGDVQVVNGVKDAVHQFFETNRSQRHTADLQMQMNLPNSRIELKATGSSFGRSIITNAHYFNGNQLNYYAELSHSLLKEKFSLVSGLNVVGDRFKKRLSDPVLLTDFSNNTVGVFSQLTANLSAQTIAEAGLRLDHHQQYGNFVLPRLALFHRFSNGWATRLGVGLGYKTPNALSQQNIDYNIEDIEPLPANAKAETSIGYNAEVNYKKAFGSESSLFINQAFFLTRLNNPLVATQQSNGHVLFANAGKNTVSKGSDTYIKAQLKSWEMYVGYTFTIAERNYLLQNKFVPLTPKNRFAFVIVREIGEAWRFGLEGSYNGRQHRYDYTLTPGYLFLAAVVSRNIGTKVTVVLNCENLTDYRQSRKESLYTGSITAPVFKPLWAPIDGRVANLSVRINLSGK